MCFEKEECFGYCGRKKRVREEELLESGIMFPLQQWLSSQYPGEIPVGPAAMEADHMETIGDRVGQERTYSRT